MLVVVVMEEEAEKRGVARYREKRAENARSEGVTMHVL